MKKLCIITALILMIFFVGSQVQANPRGGEISLKIDPIEPSAVPNDGTHEVNFSWTIKIDQVESIGCSLYTFSIYDPDGNKIEKTFSRPIQQVIRLDYNWTIPKDSKIGRYRAEIVHPSPSLHAAGYFSVGGGDLKVVKFHDRNRNGEWDKENEEGIAGWNITIEGPDESESIIHRIHRITGPDGTFTERNLMIGKFKVKEELKPHWIPTTPTLIETEVELGRTKELKFGNYYRQPGGNLSIFKFNDLNNNSIREPGEEGLEGWEFEIRLDGRLVDTCVTDPNGYCNRSLQEGTYKITERLKSGGWKATTPNPVVIDVKAGQTTNVEFGNYLVVPLSIFKFNDRNNNSIRDPGEVGLEGWEFEIRLDGRLVDTCVTDPNGYCESSLQEGTYTITERLKSGGWKATTQNPVVIDVKAGEKTNVEFGNYLGGTLSIFKFNDRNNNSIRDPGEVGLEGWEFEIRLDGRLVDTCVTDPNGYCNRSLQEGTYTITERLKSGGWKATTQNPVVIDVKAGEKTNVEFGNYPGGTLSIFKFNDRNNNSIRDPDEEGIANWSFEIRQEWQLVDTCVTDPNGYCVRELLEGRYKITEQQSRCWVSTTPKSLEIEVRGGQTTEVEFGNYAIGNLTIQKFYDDNRNKVQEYGEEGLPNWIFTITFPDGSGKRITTGANGTYKLLNVPIGRYTIIEEAMTCRWTNSTSTTKYVEVTACQETIASFGNYIADCSIPPGCPWFNEDENLNVSKSVVPCVCNITPLIEGESASKEEEPEVSVYLRVCVDKRLIKDGIAVENITVVETLHNHFTVVGDSFSEQPSNTGRNPDGTTTITWDIPSLCCEEWNVSFNVTAIVALPIDVTNTSEQVTSKVIYEDPIETGRRELSIPEGKLKFSFIVPPAPLHPICYVLGGLLVISISIEIHLERKRRKKEKSKEKE